MAIERWQPWELRPWRPFWEIEDMERLMDEAFSSRQSLDLAANTCTRNCLVASTAPIDNCF